jgi:hypothetical protein
VTRPERKAGFRLSVADAVFIAAAAGAFVLLRGRLGPGAWVIPLAVGHLFLFCNVFRVRRAYELAWAAVLLVNAAAWMLTGHFSWGGVLAVQAPFTLAAIGLEMRSRAYHGIGCRRINAAHIDEWVHGSEKLRQSRRGV